MTSDESAVIVVRAWRDAGRMVIRVLSGSGAARSEREWVFADVDASLAQIGELLNALSYDTGENDSGKNTKC